MAHDPDEPDLHRNNAAEWVMVALVWPVRLVARCWRALSSRL